MTDKDFEDRLSESIEYSLVCDDCGNESTRDGYVRFAVNHAKQEGFICTPDFGVLCYACKPAANLVKEAA